MSKIQDAVDYITSAMEREEFTRSEVQRVLEHVGRHFGCGQLGFNGMQTPELRKLENLSNPAGSNCPGTL